MMSHSPLNRQSPRPPNSRSQMHSPAPMPPNGGYGGIQMNSQYGPSSGNGGPGSQGPPMMQGGPPSQSMRGPAQGMNPDEMGPGVWNPQIQQSMIPHGGPTGQNAHGIQNGPPGGMMNPHANMMSPRPPSGQGQIMSSPHHGSSQGMSPHPQQGPLPQGGSQGCPPGQMMNMYNQQGGHSQQGPGQHPGMISHSPHPGMMSQSPRPGMMSQSPHPQPPGPGMSPHPQQMGPYPPGPGVSPHLQGQQVPNGSQSGPPHNMIHNVQNQMLPNNPQGRVMSPGQQQANGMMSPHHHLQSGQQGSSSQIQGAPGIIPQHIQGSTQIGGPRMNGPMSSNMMPPHPHGMIPQEMLPPNHRMMSPHNQGNMINPHHPNHTNHQMSGQIGGPMMGPPHIGQPQPPGGSKIYPPNQPMIFNPQNPNAPPIHPCGVCHREVQGDSEEGLMCESGCNFWFHRICINMSPEAYHFLKNEVYAEWVCDNCIVTKRIAPIKIKS